MDEKGKEQACFVGSHLSWWSRGGQTGIPHLDELLLWLESALYNPYIERVMTKFPKSLLRFTN